jgi:hypothetical protein
MSDTPTRRLFLAGGTRRCDFFCSLAQSKDSPLSPELTATIRSHQPAFDDFHHFDGPDDKANELSDLEDRTKEKLVLFPATAPRNFWQCFVTLRQPKSEYGGAPYLTDCASVAIVIAIERYLNPSTYV